DPDVQRVEVVGEQASLCTTQEAAAQNGVLSLAGVLGRHPHAIVGVLEDEIRGFVVGGEGVAVSQANFRFAGAVQGKTADGGVPGVVLQQSAARSAVPAQNGPVWILADDGT